MGIAARLWRSPMLRRLAGFEQTLWARKAADEGVRALVGVLNPSSLTALEISGDVWTNYGFKSYQSTGYPGFDLCKAPLPRTFDLVIAEHVFEHLRRPARAARHAFEMVNPGGHFLIVTPFLYRVHRDPEDFTRWTEDGLNGLLAEAGFPIAGIQTGAWGNRAAVEAHLHREFILFNRHLHSMRNEPDYPLVVWALARRAQG
jgi:SAM-dependent methyltransferase